MLPRPFEKFIPKFFKRDEKLTAFADKMDELLESFKSDTLGLNDIINPFKIPSILIEELGYYLNAGLKQTDTDRQKRIKVATAVQGHKRRSTFKFDAKPKIDAIAGGDSQVIKSTDSDDWIMGGDGVTIPTAFYWASMGSDGIDSDLGISLIGEGTEIEIAGNIYINVDNSSLTVNEIQQIVDELEDDIAPAYYRIFIGYLDLSGAFIVYAVIN